MSSMTDMTMQKESDLYFYPGVLEEDTAKMICQFIVTLMENTE